MNQKLDSTPEPSNHHSATIDFTRVNVVGVSGSGKSTLSKKLAKSLGIPRIELDQLYWKPNWQESEREDFRCRIREALAAETWVVDGNYHSACQDIKLARVTAVIWVDFSFLRTMRQAIGRAFHRAWTKKELWPGTGNRETFRKLFFSHDSIVLWTLTSYRRLQRRYTGLMNDPAYSHIHFVRLRSPQEADEFLSALSTNSAPAV